MIKKTAKKGKVTGKKSAKKRSGVRRKREELHAAEVRRDISKLVESHAEKMAQAVIGEGEKGQLAPVKYLFEMAGVYPPSADGSLPSTEEDCLAKTLLDRLNIPDKPVVADQVEEDIVVIPARVEVQDPSGDRGDEGEKDAGSGVSNTVE